MIDAQKEIGDGKICLRRCPSNLLKNKVGRNVI
jgi:hypothetical protein